MDALLPRCRDLQPAQHHRGARGARWTSSTSRASRTRRSPRAKGRSTRGPGTWWRGAMWCCRPPREHACRPRSCASSTRSSASSRTCWCGWKGKGTVLTGVGFESDPGLKHYEFKRKVQATVHTQSGACSRAMEDRSDGRSRRDRCEQWDRRARRTGCGGPGPLLRQVAGGERRHDERESWRGGRPVGSQRGRQDHHLLYGRRAAAPDAGDDLVQREGHHRRADVPASAHGPGLPGPGTRASSGG